MAHWPSHFNLSTTKLAFSEAWLFAFDQLMHAFHMAFKVGTVLRYLAVKIGSNLKHKSVGNMG